MVTECVQDLQVTKSSGQLPSLPWLYFSESTAELMVVLETLSTWLTAHLLLLLNAKRLQGLGLQTSLSILNP